MKLLGVSLLEVEFLNSVNEMSGTFTVHQSR